MLIFVAFLACGLPLFAAGQGQQLEVFRTRGSGVCPGQEAKNGDKVTWAYEGLFQDKRRFDNGTLTIILGARKVVQGVDLGLQGMCLGEEREIIVPPHLGYGAAGAPPLIPPNAVLIFKVRMLQIEPQGSTSRSRGPAAPQGPSRSGTGEVKIQNVVQQNCQRKSQSGDTIKWKYAGTLTDGTQFDAGDLTARLGANQIIPGVDIGMQGMCVGDKRRMVIPPHLAYGAAGIPNVIPPNASLIFDVELLSIN